MGFTNLPRHGRDGIYPTPPEVGRAFEQAGNREAMGMVMG